MSLILWVSVAFGVCPVDGTAALHRALDGAEAAFADLRLDDVHTAADEAAALLACPDAAVDAHDAARVHQLRGLSALLAGDRAGALAAFSAAHRADPSVAFSADAAPSGSPLAEAWAAATVEPGEPSPFRPARDGTWYVDGVAARALPGALPAVAQLVDAEGSVTRGAWIAAGGSLPDYPARYGLLGPPERRGASAALLGGTVVAAATSAALYAVAGSSASAYWDPDTPDADLPGLRKTTNGLVQASAVSGAAAVALGVTFVAVRF